MAKTALKSFSLSNSSQKLPFLVALMYALYDHPRYFKFKQKYQQYGPFFQTISPFFMTMMKSKQLPFIKKFIFLAILSVNSGFLLFSGVYGFSFFCQRAYSKTCKPRKILIWLFLNVKFFPSIAWFNMFLCLVKYLVAFKNFLWFPVI